MTKIDWKKAEDARKLHRENSGSSIDISEDSTPLKPDDPDSCKHFVRRKEKLLKKTEKRRKLKRPPKISDSRLVAAKKNKNLKPNDLSKAYEVVKKDFEKEMDDPQSALNIAAEKTRKRWQKRKTFGPKRLRVTTP